MLCNDNESLFRLKNKILGEYLLNKLIDEKEKQTEENKFLIARYLGIRGRLALIEEQISEIYLLNKSKQNIKKNEDNGEMYTTLASIKETYEKKLIKKKFMHLVEQRKKAKKELTNRIAELGMYELSQIIKVLNYTEIQILTEMQKKLKNFTQLNYRRLGGLIVNYNKRLWLFKQVSEKTQSAIVYTQVEDSTVRGLELKRRVLRKYYKTLTSYENTEASAEVISLQKTIKSGIEKLTKAINYSEKKIEKKMLRYQKLQYSYQKLRAKKFKLFRGGEGLEEKLKITETDA